MSYEAVVMYDNPNGYWRCDDLSVTEGVQAKVGKPLYLVAGVMGSTAPGPIVGDRPGSFIFLQPGALALGELLPGESGDPSALSEITIETWFASSDATPAATQNIVIGPLIATASSYGLQLLTSGAISFTCRNSAGTLHTVNSSAITTDWYHIVGTISGGSVRLYLNGAQVGSTAWTGSFAGPPPDTGLTLNFLGATSGPDTQYFDEIAFYRRGLSAARIWAHYEAGRLRGFPTQRTDLRIGAVLDAVGSHAPRNLQIGGLTNGERDIIPTFMEGQPALDELLNAMKAESVDAMFFVAGDGTVTFLPTTQRNVNPYDTVQATFGDAGGSELPYVDLDLDYSDAFLANEWNVTRDGGLVQTRSDATSIARYGRRPQSLTGLPVVSDADADNIAVAMLAKYKDPYTRVTSLTLDTSVPSVTEAVFRLDLGDRIRVLRTPPGGGARVDQTLFVQKISDAGANDQKPWSITLGVSPL
jgi:hypothetical protein